MNVRKVTPPPPKYDIAITLTWDEAVEIAEAYRYSGASQVRKKLMDAIQDILKEGPEG